MSCSLTSFSQDHAGVCWMKTQLSPERQNEFMSACCPDASKILDTDDGCFSYCEVGDAKEWEYCIQEEFLPRDFWGNKGDGFGCVHEKEEGEVGGKKELRDLQGDLAIAKAIEGILEVVESVVVSMPVGTRTSTLGQGSTTSQQPTATSKQSTSISQQATSTATPLYFTITNSSSVATNSSTVSNLTAIAFPPKTNTTLSNSPPPPFSNSTGSSNGTVHPSVLYPNTTKPTTIPGTGDTQPTTLIPGPVNTPPPVSTAPTPHSTSVLHVPGTITNDGVTGRGLSVGTTVLFGLLLSGLLL